MSNGELWDSLKKGDLAEVERLVALKPWLINARGEWGWTVLHYAVSSGLLDLVKWLLSHGSEIDARDDNDETALFQVADVNPPQVEIILLLLSAGADINAQNSRGWTPLHECAFYGDGPTAQFLIEHGAIVNSRDRQGLTPLHLAAQAGLADMVTLLIMHGAVDNSVSTDGYTPLHAAISANIMRHQLQYHLATIEALLNRNADILAQTSDAKTPFDLAIAQAGYPEIAQLLMRYRTG